MHLLDVTCHLQFPIFHRCIVKLQVTGNVIKSIGCGCPESLTLGIVRKFESFGEPRRHKRLGINCCLDGRRVR